MGKAPQSEPYEPPRLVTLGSVDDLTLQTIKAFGDTDGFQLITGEDLSGTIP